MPRVTRRVRILVCLLLGLVISVTVAWTIAFVGQPRPPTGPQQRVDLDLPPRENWKWLVNHRATIGHHIYIFRLGRNKTTRERSRVAALSSLHHSALPGWVNRPTRGMYHETHAYGFPFLCLARKEWNSHDPDFDEKARAICKLYVDAPRLYQQGRLVICCDEKTGMQILERKHPTKPLICGIPERREHE